MLKPAVALSLTLQDDRVNTVDGIKQILRAHQSLNKLSSQDPLLQRWFLAGSRWKMAARSTKELRYVLTVIQWLRAVNSRL